MTNVIDLDARRSVWMGGLGVCGLCGTCWKAVAHRDCLWRLECPVCGEMAGTIIPAEAIHEDGFGRMLDRFPQTDALEPGDAVDMAGWWAQRHGPEGALEGECES